MWTYKDKASGQANAGRLAGGGTLTLKAGEGAKFGDDISPTSPMRITVYRGTVLLGVLKCVGRSGDVLTIDGTADGYADFAVQVNDKVANVPAAGDLNDLWSDISLKQDELPANGVSGQFLAHDFTFKTPPTTDLSNYYTKGQVDSSLAAKENNLPTGGTSGQFLAYDKTWKTPPATDLSNYYTKSQVDTSLSGKASTSTTNGLDTRLTTAEGNITSLSTNKADNSALTSGLAGKEPIITAGSASQYIKGNKTLGTFVADVLSSLPSQTGNAGKVLQTDGTNLSWQTPSGGGSPGGSSGQIQYNNSGAFAGSSSFVYDPVNKRFGVGTSTPASTIDIQANGSEDLAVFRSSSGTALVKFTNNGSGFVEKLNFALAQGVDLATGTNLSKSGHIAAFAGTIAKVVVQATTNGGSGGFTLQVYKNGSSIFTTDPTVASSTTTVQTFTPTTTAVSANDVFTVNCTATGSGVQSVLVTVVMLVRNQ